MLLIVSSRSEADSPIVSRSLLIEEASLTMLSATSVILLEIALFLSDTVVTSPKDSSKNLVRSPRALIVVTIVSTVIITSIIISSISFSISVRVAMVMTTLKKFETAKPITPTLTLNLSREIRNTIKKGIM